MLDIKLILVVFTSLLIIAGCSEDDSVDPRLGISRQINYQSDMNININLYQFEEDVISGADEEENASLLFDGKKDTTWIADRAGCNLKIKLTLNNSKLIDSIKLVLMNDDNKFLKIKKVLLSAHKDSGIGDPIFGDHIVYDVLDGDLEKNVILEFSEGTLMGLFPVKTLLLSVRECHESSVADKLALRDVEIIWAKDAVYLPRNSISQIKEKYVLSKKSWFVPRGEFSDLLSEQDIVLADLAYYVLNGSDVAEQLFYSYRPTGSLSGAEYAYAKAWLEMSKH